MPWAPTVAEELRNDVRFALGWKIGKKLRPITDVERDMVDRRAHPAVQLARREEPRRAPLHPGYEIPVAGL
jgi:hypothetical protein